MAALLLPLIVLALGTSAAAVDQISKQLVFDPNTPAVFYCPQNEPPPYPATDISRSAHPLDKLCEFNGGPKPYDYMSDCYNDIDETEFACEQKARIQLLRAQGVDSSDSTTMTSIPLPDSDISLSHHHLYRHNNPNVDTEVPTVIYNGEEVGVEIHTGTVQYSNLNSDNSHSVETTPPITSVHEGSGGYVSSEAHSSDIAESRSADADDLDSEHDPTSRHDTDDLFSARQNPVRAEHKRDKKGPGPSVDEIISGIIQLMAGNVKLGRPNSQSSNQNNQNNQNGNNQQQANQIDRKSNVGHVTMQSLNGNRHNTRGPPNMPFSPHHHLSAQVPPHLLPGNMMPDQIPANIMLNGLHPPGIGGHHGGGFPLPLPRLPPMKQVPIPIHAAQPHPPQPPPQVMIPTRATPAQHVPEQDVSALLGLMKPAEEHVNDFHNTGSSTEADRPLRPSTEFPPFNDRHPTPALASSPVHTELFIGSANHGMSSDGGLPLQPNGPITDWVPLYTGEPAEGDATKTGPGPAYTTAIEEPMIITLPDNYGPSTFDVVVKHNIGTGVEPTRAEVTSINIVASAVLPSIVVPDEHVTHSGANNYNDQNNLQPSINYFYPSSSMDRIEPSSSEILPTPTFTGPEQTPGLSSNSKSRIYEGDVVYGRPVHRHKQKPSTTTTGANNLAVLPTKSNPPHQSDGSQTITISATSVSAQNQNQNPSVGVSQPTASHHQRTQSGNHHNQSPSSSLQDNNNSLGKPFVTAVDVDEVKPHISNNQHSNVQTPPTTTNQNSGSRKPQATNKPASSSNGNPSADNNKAANGLPTMQVGHGVHVSGAEEEVSSSGSASPKPNPSQSSGHPQVPGLGQGVGSATAASSSQKSPVVRRPPFRPRPNVPVVRIDTCIVGDDSTCERDHHERCLTEAGISSCHCRPGYGRLGSRGMCHPVINLAVSVKVDRLQEKRVLFNRNLLNPNSEEYQYLEYEGTQALNSAFGLSKLSRVFLGTKINKFYSVGGRTLMNATVSLEANNATQSSSVKKLIQGELSRIIATRGNQIGESLLWVDGSLNAVPRVEDLNECSATDLNDCSKHGYCINEMGGYRCACLPGYEDKSMLIHSQKSNTVEHVGPSLVPEKWRTGRLCAPCSPQYCSNRGECLVMSDGTRSCRCKGNYIGSRCEIDGEVLGVALGGSLAALIIILVTFLCLYMWNRKWKKEQQKIEAMSAESGATYSNAYLHAGTTSKTNASYRIVADDRGRWAIPDYYQTADHIGTLSSHHPSAAATAHSTHVYATPSGLVRSQATPEHLISYESHDQVDSRTVAAAHAHQQQQQAQYARSMRPKSRASTAIYATGVGPSSLYNETEFSVREAIYAPAHLNLAYS